MADDVIGMMDALGIEKANIFGMSLGGMVAQHLAFGHGARMAHVVCVMSSSGNPALPRPAASELAPPDDADDTQALEAYLVDMLGEHMSPAFPTPIESSAKNWRRGWRAQLSPARHCSANGGRHCRWQSGRSPENHQRAVYGHSRHR